MAGKASRAHQELKSRSQFSFRELCGAAVAVLCCFSLPALAENEHISKRTVANRQVALPGYTHSDNNCRSSARPEIYLTVAPSHGTVCVSHETVKVERAIFDRSRPPLCKDHLVSGTRLIYAPLSGFTGSDALEYAVHFPTRIWVVRAGISVRPPAAGLSTPDGSVPSTVSPSLGPVPICAPLVS